MDLAARVLRGEIVMAEKLVNLTGNTMVDGVGRVLDPSSRNFAAAVLSMGTPLTGEEFNFIQQIQNQLRASVFRAVMTDGFLYKEGHTETEPGYGKYQSGIATDKIRIGPCQAMINGYLFDIMDSNADPDTHYNVVTFSAGSGRTDLVFLEAWEEEIAPPGNEENLSSAVHLHGSHDAVLLSNDFINPLAGVETTRRIQLKWRIRVVEDVDFVTHPKGVTAAKALGGKELETQLGFTETRVGLFVAGDGTLASAVQLNTVDGYSYAVPMFKVSITGNTLTSADVVDLRPECTLRLKAVGVV